MGRTVADGTGATVGRKRVGARTSAAGVMVGSGVSVSVGLACWLDPAIRKTIKPRLKSSTNAHTTATCFFIITIKRNHTLIKATNIKKNVEHQELQDENKKIR